MNKQHVYKVEGMHCHSCEILIKEELSKLPGIKYIEASEHRGEVLIECEGEIPSIEKLNDIFKEEKFTFSDFVSPEPGYPLGREADKEAQNLEPAAITIEKPIDKNQGEAEKTENSNWAGKNTKEHIYKVEGMHCASCEILIEKKLLEIQNVKSVDASTVSGQVVVEYEGDRPNPERLSKIFREENYAFSDLNSPKPAKTKESSAPKKTNATLIAFNIAIFIIIAFLVLDKMGIANFLSLSSTSSLLTFLGFGFLAGMSSCAALVGGIVLSMSKQWNSLYSEDQSTSKKLQPHIMFNAGRVVSYAVLGGALGMIGSRLQISPRFTAYLVVAISLLMVALGLQMLGVKAFRKFQITAPKSATRYIANENNFQGKYMPFIMGALTFFLPCGFTITAQSLALLSGNAVQGALIMGAFALGTIPVLFFIGLSSVKFSSKPHLAERFSKVAGFLVLFFALFNMSNQAAVLGFSGFNPGVTQTVNQNDLPPIVDGKQVIKMVASGSADSPNYFKVRVGVPIRWEITGGSSLGCNGAIISTNLFDGAVDLTPGQVSVKEFTIQNPGKYGFSCTMGMVRGTIEAVNADNVGAPSGSSAIDSNIVVAATVPDNQVVATTDGTQVIKMTASGSGDTPNYFKVKVGVPVRWEITASGNMGCNNAIMSSSLFDGTIPLTPGQVAVKEFTPKAVGKYGFSCSMGMIKGVIEVVSAGSDVTASAPSVANDQVVPSGAKGCGCGGGGGGNTCGG